MNNPHHLKQNMKRLGGLAILFALALAGTYLPLRAADGTWLGAVDTLWSRDSNWSQSPYPNGAGEIATLNDTGSLTPTLVLTEAIALDTIVFDSAADYTISTGNSSGLTLSTITASAGAGALEISVPITLASNLTVDQDAVGTLSLSGNIAQTGGDRSVTKNGTGTLLLSGDNAYAGGTTVNADPTLGIGTLALGSDTAAGTGRITLNHDTTLYAVGDRVLDNALTFEDDTVYTGTGSLAFTSMTTDIGGDADIYVQTTTSFAKIRSGGASFDLSKLGSGDMDLNISGADNPHGLLRNDQGPGQLNIYGSGTLGRVYYNPGTGGGTIGVGDTLDVATRFLSRGTGILTLQGDLNLSSNTAAASNITLTFDLNGDTPGAGYDQIQIVQGGTGTSRSYLNYAILDVSLGYTPTVNTVFTIITRTGGTSPENDVISGIFRDLPHGSIFTADGIPLLINYTDDTVILERVEIGPGEPAVFTLTPTAGTPQTTTLGTPFAIPLTVTVTSDGVPQEGVLVVFEAPLEGPSATFAGGNSAVTDINGQAAVTVTANMQAGSYVVTANTSPNEVTPASFELNNVGWLYLPIVLKQWPGP